MKVSPVGIVLILCLAATWSADGIRTRIQQKHQIDPKVVEATAEAVNDVVDFLVPKQPATPSPANPTPSKDGVNKDVDLAKQIKDAIVGVTKSSSNDKGPKQQEENATQNEATDGHHSVNAGPGSPHPGDPPPPGLHSDEGCRGPDLAQPQSPPPRVELTQFRERVHNLTRRLEKLSEEVRACPKLLEDPIPRAGLGTRRGPQPLGQERQKAYSTFPYCAQFGWRNTSTPVDRNQSLVVPLGSDSDPIANQNTTTTAPSPTPTPAPIPFCSRELCAKLVANPLSKECEGTHLRRPSVLPASSGGVKRGYHKGPQSPLRTFTSMERKD